MFSVTSASISSQDFQVCPRNVRPKFADGYAQLSGNDFLLRNLMCTQLRTSFGNQYQRRLCWYPRRPKPPPKKVSGHERHTYKPDKTLWQEVFGCLGHEQFQGSVGPSYPIIFPSHTEREEVRVWDPKKLCLNEMFGGPFTPILRRHGKTTKTLAKPET